MNMLLEQIRKIQSHIRQEGVFCVSMRIRLFGFLAVLVITMLLFVFIILLLTGGFTAGLREVENFYTNELKRISKDVEHEYGSISVSAVGLSDALSQSIERFLSEKDISAGDLQQSPEILEELLDREFDRLLFSLEKTGASGAFIILDATINNLIQDAEFSRTGLYLKNMEPNVISLTSPTITILRGFPDIGRKRGYSLHAQWDMEFTINNSSYFFLPLEEAKETIRPLSRLYYWSPSMAIPNTSENIMICSVPLIDSKGNVFGVCGYEVSAMLFKLKFMPDNSVYNRIFCMLSSLEGSDLQTEGAIFSGNYDAFGITGDTKPLMVKKQSNSLFSYEKQDGITLVGNHKIIRLYPEDSAFADTNFAISLLMPQKDLNRILFPMKIRLILLCISFLLIGIAASIFISNKYINPIISGLAAISSQDIDDIAKTNITEIDEIIEQIRAMSRNKALLHDNLFEEFISKVKTLTPTEKKIFKYYAEGKTNKEILSLMYISLSTFKTHNGHIYSKLGISSKDELLLYVKLIQKSGYISEIE